MDFIATDRIGPMPETNEYIEPAQVVSGELFSEEGLRVLTEMGVLVPFAGASPYNGGAQEPAVESTSEVSDGTDNSDSN